MKEFFKAYHDLSNGKELVKPVKRKFKEFIRWSQEQRDRDAGKQENFWRNYLKGFDSPTELSIKRVSTLKEFSSSGHFRFRFDRDAKIEWDGFIKKRKITLASLF